MNKQNGQKAGMPSPERLGCALTADMLTAEDWEDMLATHNRIAAEMADLKDRVFKRHNTKGEAPQ